MIIGEAASRSGLPTKTVRYYEQIGLVRPGRRGNNYRSYSEADVHELRFVARARALGFSVEDCRHLLSLYRNKTRSSAEVREAAERHIAEIRTKMAELQEMERTLSALVRACHGDARPGCPILEGLSGTSDPDR